MGKLRAADGERGRQACPSRPKRTQIGDKLVTPTAAAASRQSSAPAAATPPHRREERRVGRRRTPRSAREEDRRRRATQALPGDALGSGRGGRGR
jgi:hypothetical protein